MIKLCRFETLSGTARVGIVEADGLRDITATADSLWKLLEFPQPLMAGQFASAPLVNASGARLLPPVEHQEVWAAGVTYLRSKKARMEESDFSASAYDRVYEAPRPEIFFKSMPSKVVGPFGQVGIRRDAKWNVPEPELALVINSRRELAGFTIGNDMSSRDIEGENLLYLPQAKIYKGSCALGPCIVTGATEAEARGWTIEVRITRNGVEVFSGATSVDQIKRRFDELIDYLCRSQEFPNGVVLLTGTGVVPGDDFTLQPGDKIAITISGIGTLENEVAEV
jgi:2-dehydro-3-deoxy-D-arabinonate dehydratase